MAANTTTPHALDTSDRTIRFQTTTDPAVLERFPTIFIIGVQKAATTSLSHVLRNADNIETSESPQAKHYDGETHYIADCSRRRACGTAEYAQLWLNQSHRPEVRVPTAVERTWLNQSHRPDVSWVESNGDGVGDSATLKFDPTPNDFASVSAPAVLLAIYPPALMPRCRLIAALREPASRLLSWYNHRRREYWTAHPGMSDPSFCGRPNIFLRYSNIHIPSLMVHGELREDGGSAHFVPNFHTTAVCWLKWYRNMSKSFLQLSALPERSSPKGTAYTTPLLTGHYASHLRRWQNTGWPRSQLLVVGFAELADPSSDALQRVLDFVGARGLTSPRLSGYNNGGNFKGGNAEGVVSSLWGRVPPASVPPLVARMCCETLLQLKRHYAEPNERLYQQLEDDRNTSSAPPMEAPMARFEDPSCDASCDKRELVEGVFQTPSRVGSQ